MRLRGYGVWKKFSNKVLNRFRKRTVDLLKSIDVELKAQNLLFMKSLNLMDLALDKKK
ncbi:MAG: hypothetical protein ACJARP_003273 [Vicingaceae bacterium]|jgi:hypothetical protein